MHWTSLCPHLAPPLGKIPWNCWSEGKNHFKGLASWNITHFCADIFQQSIRMLSEHSNNWVPKVTLTPGRGVGTVRLQTEPQSVARQRQGCGRLLPWSGITGWVWLGTGILGWAPSPSHLLSVLWTLHSDPAADPGNGSERARLSVCVLQATPPPPPQLQRVLGKQALG